MAIKVSDLLLDIYSLKLIQSIIIDISLLNQYLLHFHLQIQLFLSQRVFWTIGGINNLLESGIRTNWKSFFHLQLLMLKTHSFGGYSTNKIIRS